LKGGLSRMPESPRPDLAAIRARLQAVGAADWFDDGWDCFAEGKEWVRVVQDRISDTVVAECPSDLLGSAADIPADNPAGARATLIAHAPSDLTALLDVADAARGLLAELQELVAAGASGATWAALNAQPLHKLDQAHEKAYAAIRALSDALGETAK
jgi:hypothetical protein